MKYLWIIPFSLIMLGFASCTDPPDPWIPPPPILILEGPTALLANLDSCYTYRAALPVGFTDSIMVEVHSPDGNVHSSFALYDDGGIFPAMPPEYACSSSGDIVPNNDQFTRRISGRLLADSVIGSYTFRFHATGADDQTITVQIQNAEPCLITFYPQVTQLDSCFVPINMEVRVARTEGDVVDTVRVLLCDPLRSCTALGDFAPVQGDTVWQLLLTPAMFRCAQSFDSSAGFYSLLYQAKTRFGMNCEQDVGPVGFFNSHPVLSNSTLPDTIYRPTQQGVTDTIIVTVNMQDCELAGELYYYSLRFEVRREDTTEWTPHPDFFLRDDGIAPDSVPGNGIYTVGLTFDRRDDLPNFLYYFQFYAIECAAPNDTSAILLDSVRVIQPPGLFTSSGGRVIRGEPDFRVLN